MLRAPFVSRWDPVDGAGVQGPIRLIAAVGGTPGRGVGSSRHRAATRGFVSCFRSAGRWRICMSCVHFSFRVSQANSRLGMGPCASRGGSTRLLRLQARRPVEYQRKALAGRPIRFEQEKPLPVRGGRVLVQEGRTHSRLKQCGRRAQIERWLR